MYMVNQITHAMRECMKVIEKDRKEIYACMQRERQRKTETGRLGETEREERARRI